MSKGAKLAAKRAGRPRKDGEREANGRLRRNPPPPPREPADKIALEARARHMRITTAEAKDQRAATFIGVLAIHGAKDGISAEQYEALATYAGIKADYLRAIAAPGAGLASEGGSGGHQISPGYIRWCSTARERHAEMQAAIERGQTMHRRENLLATLDLCVMQGQAHWHLVPSLRTIANVLVAHFGLQAATPATQADASRRASTG